MEAINLYEDNKFSENIDKFLKNELKSQEVITVCKTPNIFKILGSNAEKLIITQNVLRNSLSDESIKNKGHTSGHNLTVDLIKNLSKQLRNPILICKGSSKNKRAFVLITELKNKKETAKKMLEENIDIEIIIRITGLTKEEIMNVK